MAHELAPARELDVFVKEKLTPAARDIAPRRGGRAIEAEFSRKTADALERARRSVATARFRALLLDVLEWIETGHKVSGDADIAVGKFARDALHRRIRKARKDGRHLIELSVRRRHKLRIRVKKIRYAVEFFESLFPGKRKRKQFERLSKHLKRLQHALGSLNDFVAHRQIAADAALNAPPQNRRARAFTSGVVVGKEIEAAKPLMKAADKEVRALRRFRKF